MSNTQYGLSKAGEFVAALVDITVEEWRNRTTYGKLWYPVWFVSSVAQWLLAIAILTPVAIFMKTVEALDETEKSTLGPDIYRGEE